MNFTRVYSDKSVFTKVGENFGGDLKNSEVTANEVVWSSNHFPADILKLQFKGCLSDGKITSQILMT